MQLHGIADRWTDGIPDRWQNALDTFRADGELRLIWNPVTRTHTVVIRNPAVRTAWHGNEVLEGWAIVSHTDCPIRGMGDVDRTKERLSKMFRRSHYASMKQAQEHIDHLVEEAEEKQEQEAEAHFNDWFDDVYPDGYFQQKAFLEDVERGENAAREYNSQRARRRRRRGKVKVGK